jgi:hypothetical protein
MDEPFANGPAAPADKEDSMPELIVMDRTGDSRMTFNASADSPETVKAMARFTEMTRKGYIAYSKAEDGSTKLIRAFDPNAAEIIMNPQLIGG